MRNYHAQTVELGTETEEKCKLHEATQPGPPASTSAPLLCSPTEDIYRGHQNAVVQSGLPPPSVTVVGGSKTKLYYKKTEIIVFIKIQNGRLTVRMALQTSAELTSSHDPSELKLKYRTTVTEDCLKTHQTDTYN